MSEIVITDDDLNTMNQVLYGMWRLKPRQRRPVFSVAQIVDEWHVAVDDTASVDFIEAILVEGSRTGFFLFYQCLSGSLFYGYNSRMLLLNKKNKNILLAAPRADRLCLEPCNTPRNPTCIVVDPTPSDCCFTQWKGTVAGGSISSVCGVSMNTSLWMCNQQQTEFCN